MDVQAPRLNGSGVRPTTGVQLRGPERSEGHVSCNVRVGLHICAVRIRSTELLPRVQPSMDPNVSGHRLMRTPLVPNVDDVGGRSAVKHTWRSKRAKPTTVLVEGTASELGQGGHVHCAEAFASNSTTCLAPKTTADTSPAIFGQNMDDVDFYLGVNASLSSFTTTDEPNDPSLGLCDEIHAPRFCLARRQTTFPVCPFALPVGLWPDLGQRRISVPSGLDVNARDALGICKPRWSNEAIVLSVHDLLPIASLMGLVSTVSPPPWGHPIVRITGPLARRRSPGHGATRSPGLSGPTIESKGRVLPRWREAPSGGPSEVSGVNHD